MLITLRALTPSDVEAHNEYNADAHDDHERGDVRISYAVHPWARGRGVAVKAVALICEHIREHEIGTRVVIRVEPENDASVRVAEKSGFTYVHDFISATHKNPDGTPAILRLYVHNL